MASESIFNSIVLTPTGVGIIMLFISAVFGRRPLTFALMCVIAVGLHLLTVAEFRTFEGYFGGSAMKSDASDRFARVGFEFIGGLIAIKLAFGLLLSWRARRQRCAPESQRRYDY